MSPTEQTTLADLQSQGNPTLNSLDVIRLHITGSRGGGPAEMVKGRFNWQGICVDEFGTPVPDVLPMDLSALGGGAVSLPEFPQAAYAAATTPQEKIQIMQVHQEALAAAQVNGAASTVEEGLIKAALNYCYDNLGFSPTDVEDKYVVTAADVQLDKVSRPVGGKEYTIRLASRFGR
jgi:hypothetical protein